MTNKTLVRHTPASLDFRTIFESIPGAFLVVLPDFKIVAVSDAYLHATMTTRDEVIGRDLFEVFPDHANDDVGSNAADNLRLSLNTVLHSKKPHIMPAQKYGIRRPASEGGGFEERCWRPVNSPVFDANQQLAFIIHRVIDITCRQRAEEALRESEENFRMFAENLREMVWITNPCGKRFLYVSPASSDIVGIDREVLRKKPLLWKKLIYQEDMPVFRAALLKQAQGEVAEAEVRIVRPDGKMRWIRARSFPFKTNCGELMASGIAEDITRHKYAEEALRESEAFLQPILDSSPDCIKVLDLDGMLIRINTGGCRQMEIDDPAHYLHRPWLSFWNGTARLAAQSALDAARNGATSQFQGHSPTAKGNQKWWEVTLVPILDRDGRPERILCISRDVTAVKHMVMRMSYEASHDALTGLVNRRGFENILQTGLSSIGEHHKHHALLYFDLDQFKIVNDTCGHIAGDELLRQLSKLLLSKMRASDTLARLGGDEFGILLEGCNLKEAERIASSLVKTIETFRFMWDSRTFSISASVGVVCITEENRHLTTILCAADAACYAAKEKGRNRVNVYHPEDADIQQRRGQMRWVSRIKQAIEENRFRLYCQRIASLKNASEGKHQHYEILLRMENQDGIIIPPMAFIPAAERYNLMPAIDRWVTRKTLETLASSEYDLSRNWYSINVSGVTLGDESFLDFVLQQLKRTSVAPQGICFEITETTVIRNIDLATKFISSLREIGCHFALDDFGTGLSSFAYLKNLRVDHLKIDGIFIRGLVSDPTNQVIVKAINEVGHAMGKKTIAEFVESEEIFGYLAQIGVDYIQGYAIHHPEPLRPF